MDFVPEVSAIAKENIEVDSDTFALIQAHLNMDLPGIIVQNDGGFRGGFRGGRR